MDDKLLTLNDLADYLSVSRRTVYRLMKGESMPAYRLGSHLRFRRGEIDEWLEGKKVPDEDAPSVDPERIENSGK